MIRERQSFLHFVRKNAVTPCAASDLRPRDQRCLPWLSRHLQGDSYVTSGAPAAVLQRKAAVMSVAARVIAPVHSTLSLPCGAQKRQNPEDVLGFLEHGRVGQLVVVGTYVPVWCLWHLEEATGERSTALWSLVWPVALWLDSRDKRAEKH